jgi:hypothetical protein
MSDAGEAAGKPRTIFLVVAFYLICIFLWRFVAPAHEYPSRTLQVVTMAFDLLAVVGLIGLRVQTARSYPADDAVRTMAAALFWIALAAGIGLFAIRLSSDAAWWTGHRVYTLLPR